MTVVVVVAVWFAVCSAVVAWFAVAAAERRAAEADALARRAYRIGFRDGEVESMRQAVRAGHPSALGHVATGLDALEQYLREQR